MKIHPLVFQKLMIVHHFFTQIPDGFKQYDIISSLRRRLDVLDFNPISETGALHSQA